MNLSYYRIFALAAVGFPGFPVAADLLEPYTRAEGSWKQSSWLGWVSGTPDKPYRHMDHHWIYLHEEGPWLWIWDYGLGEWFATQPELYPHLYDSGSRHWFSYQERRDGLRCYRDIKTAESFSEYHGMLMPETLQSLMGQAEGLLEDTADTELDAVLLEVLGWVLLPIVGDPETSTCPVIRREPAEVNLFALPPELTASADFGAGCEPEEGYGMISGRLDLEIRDLVLDMETGESVGLDLDLVATDLRRDGEPVLDGALSLGFSIDSTTTENQTETYWVTTTDAALAANMAATGLSVMGDAVTGAASLDGTVRSVVYEDLVTSEETEDLRMDVTMTMEDLSGFGMSLSSGTLRVEVDTEAGTASVEATGHGSEGAIDLELVARLSADQTRITLNTAEPAQLMGYTLEVDEVIYDGEICPDSPISGTIRIGFDDLTYQMSFTGDCGEPYRMERL